jgi:parallel beta-helix repeat protein
LSKKYPVYGICLLLICSIFLPLSTGQTVKNSNINKKPMVSIFDGNTLYVGGNGPNNYTRIQDAINDAINGDIVFVYNGTYYEQLIIEKSIKLLGEKTDTTIINVNWSEIGVKLKAHNIKISRFTLKNIHSAGIEISSINNEIDNNIIINTNSTGIYFSKGSYGNIITNNVIIATDEEGWCGIESYFTSGHIIIGNSIYGFSRGIKIFGAEDVIIIDNIVTNIYNKNMKGIFLWQTDYIEVRDNHISKVHEGIHLMGCINMDIINNTITNSDIGLKLGGAFFSNLSLNRINNLSQWGIAIGLASHLDLYQNIIENIKREDIRLGHADNLTIIDNYIEKGIVFTIPASDLDHWNTHTIRNNYAFNGPIIFLSNTNSKTVSYPVGQVILANCTNCIIHHVNITNFDVPITLGYSDYNIIKDNYLSSNNIGIRLIQSDKNIIYNNYLQNHVCGINLPVAGTKNIIARNRLVNDDYGFQLNNFWNYNCNNNYIIYNEISSDFRGLYISNGMIKTKNNCIHHNNFRNAKVNAFDYNGGNLWDNCYPSGGNYWDDYNGTDSDGDGLGDTPYEIWGYDNHADPIIQGYDRYPFMQSIDQTNVPPLCTEFSGPDGKPRKTYYYSIELVDPDGEAYYYKLDWGDGTGTKWIGPLFSWEQLKVSHKWLRTGSYDVTVILKDARGAQSEKNFTVNIQDGNNLISILKPEKAIYYYNEKVLLRLLGIPIIIGDIEIKINVSERIHDVQQIDIFIDGKHKFTSYKYPFNYIWKRDRPRLLFHSHLITIKVTDKAGNIFKEYLLVRRYF